MAHRGRKLEIPSRSRDINALIGCAGVAMAVYRQGLAMFKYHLTRTIAIEKHSLKLVSIQTE